MPNHAGFAASIAIRQQLLQDLIRILHHNDILPHVFPIALPGISSSMYLEPISINCSTARPTILGVDFVARGSLRITPPGGVSATRTTLFRARMLAVPQPVITSGALHLQFDGPRSTLDYFDIDPIIGDPYPVQVQQYLDSNTVRDGIENQMREMLTLFGSIAPPLDISFLGGIANVEEATVTALMADEALILGIDVNDIDGITTNGRRNELTDTTAGNEIGMWTNPLVLPIVLADLKEELENKAKDRGVTLTSLIFSLKEDAMHIVGSGTKEHFGSAAFSLDAVPRLIRPGHHEEWDEEYGEHFEINTPAREELWFEQTNIETDLQPAWWIYALGGIISVLGLGVGALIVKSLVDMYRHNIVSNIGQGRAGAARVQEFTFSGLPNPKFRLKIERYECHEEGIYTGITLKPQIGAPKVAGPEIINIEYALTTTLRYRLLLPFNLHPNDPMLFVRWTVRRTDTNEIIRNIDVQANAGLVLDLTGEPVLLQTPKLRIACRVYSTFGPITTDLFQARVSLRVSDNLDRSHPFVRWQHQVFPPVVRVEADGSHTELGFHPVFRTSAIHRTAVPGRCRMVSRYSINSPKATTDPNLLSHIDYFDELPFPIEEIVAHRDILCDYCFFGGPDKKVPLI